MKKKQIVAAVLFLLLSCKTEQQKIIKSYANGRPKIIYLYSDKKDIYKNNLINGTAMFYDSLGKLARTDDIVKGKLNGKETLYYPSGQVESITNVRNDSAYGFEYQFKENGDTSKAFVYYGFSVNGTFYKKWLANNTILTGNYGDTNRSFVIWKWIDKNGKEIKSLIDKGNNETFVAPE